MSRVTSLIAILVMILLPRDLLAAEAPEVTDIGWGFTSAYAIRGEGGVVLVDSRYPGDDRRLLKRMRKAGIDPDAVTLVVLTHGHADHAGSARALADALEVPVAAGAGDLEMLSAGRFSAHPTGGRGRLVKPFVKKRFPPSSVDVVVEDRLDLRPYGVVGEARLVGGHTGGSLVIRLDSGAVLCGDLVRGHMVRKGKPTLHFFHDDLDRAHAALAEALDGAAQVYPGHGGPFAPAEVERWLDRQ